MSVSTAFDQARAEDRAALVGYLPAGFPDVEGGIEAIKVLVDAGCDVIEIGLPYSDPVMDGPVIQEATQAALAGGFRLRHGFDAVREIRARVDVPVLVMTYYNPVLQYGVERFATDLAEAGGSGLITPDLIPDEGAEWMAVSERLGLDRVFLAAPSSSDERLRTAGSDSACVGVGVSTGDQVAEILAYADGAIVGSALVRALASGGVAAVAETARGLAEGTRPRA